MMFETQMEKMMAGGDVIDFPRGLAPDDVVSVMRALREVKDTDFWKEILRIERSVTK